MSLQNRIDFIGIGATKSGSSWLSDMLAAHPEVCLSEPKEIRYFNPTIAPGHREVNPNAGRDLDWYHGHFRHCKKGLVRGEYTPLYMADKASIDCILAYNPAVKLIVCLRNPVDRLLSHYLMNRDYIGTVTRPLGEEIKADPRYLLQGRYGEQLEYLYSQCNPKQVLVLFTDELKADKSAVLSRLYQFIGVDKNFRPSSMEQPSNEAKRSRFAWAGKFINALPRLMVKLKLNWLLAALRKINLHKLILSLLTVKASGNESADIIDPALRQQLRDYYRDDVTTLAGITGKDLSHWLDD